jgi:hypothetical protein
MGCTGLMYVKVFLVMSIGGKFWFDCSHQDYEVPYGGEHTTQIFNKKIRSLDEEK